MVTDDLTSSTPSPQLITSRDTGVWFFECANCGTDACVVNVESGLQAFQTAKAAGWRSVGEMICPVCIASNPHGLPLEEASSTTPSVSIS